MPVDTNIKVEKKETAEYPPLPKDIYQAELLDITSEEKVTYNTKNKPEEEQELEVQMSCQFVLLEGKEVKDGKEKSLRGRMVWVNYVPTFLYISKKYGKNKLFRLAEAILGRELTPEDEATLDGNVINTFIGKQCRLNVEPKVSGDKTYNNVTDLLKINDKLDALTPEEKEKFNKKEETTTDTPKPLEPGDEGYVAPEDIPF